MSFGRLNGCGSISWRVSRAFIVRKTQESKEESVIEVRWEGRDRKLEPWREPGRYESYCARLLAWLARSAEDQTI